MLIEEVIKDYCYQYELLLPECEQKCFVAMQLGTQTLWLDYRPEDAAIFLRAPLAIAELSPIELAMLYRRLLVANLAFSQSDGLYFSIDDDSIELLLRLDITQVETAACIDTAVSKLYAASLQADGLLQNSPGDKVPQTDLELQQKMIKI